MRSTALNAACYRMDVFYTPSERPSGVPSDVPVYGPATVDVRRSWDGSLYAETNVRELAGPDRQITGWVGPSHLGRRRFEDVRIEGTYMNCPTTIPDDQPELMLWPVESK